MGQRGSAEKCMPCHDGTANSGWLQKKRRDRTKKQFYIHLYVHQSVIEQQTKETKLKNSTRPSEEKKDKNLDIKTYNR